VLASTAAVASLAGARALPARAAAPAVPYRSRPDLVPPGVVVTTPANGAAPGYLFLAPFDGTGQQGPLIVDDSGEPVWFHEVVGAQAQNFRPQTFAGRPVLTWWAGAVGDNGTWMGQCFIADDTYHVVAVLTGAHGYRPEIHEFVITSRDTALMSMNNLVTADLSAYGGLADATVVESVFQEIDITSGNVLLEWHSLDHISYDESYLPVTSTWDYCHLNSIGVDVDDNLLISCRYPSTVYKLDRVSGEVLWRLGGKNSDFAMGPGTTFGFQHDARGHAGGLLSLFDDGAYSPQTAIEPVSRALLLSLDTSSMTCTLELELPNPDGALSTAMGNAQRLADDGFVVGWGTTPSLSEFATDGTLRFEAKLTVPSQISYRAFREAWVGKPTGSPAVAVDTSTGGADVYVSWNGATQVAHWEVLGGTAAGHLVSLAVAPRSGFETAIHLRAAPRVLTVAGLDATGRELGRSALVRL